MFICRGAGLHRKDGVKMSEVAISLAHEMPL